MRVLTVISALQRLFCMARMTLDSKLSPRMRVSFLRPCSICLRMSGVISYCLPVYSTFIELPLLNRTGHPQPCPRVKDHIRTFAALAGAFPPPWVADYRFALPGFSRSSSKASCLLRASRLPIVHLVVCGREFIPRHQRRQSGKNLVLHPALMGGRYFHVLPILRDRAASDLDTLRLEDAGDLLVRQRPGGIFFLDQLLDPALENQQRRVAAFGPLHAFAEEITKLENALRG